MADDVLKEARKRYGRFALKTLAESVEHIRACPRCERLFLVAYEASEEQSGGIDPDSPKMITVSSTDVWLITKELLHEFRQCAGWPKEV
jgi:hypothetical protein